MDVKKGDFVNLDYTGKVEGKVFDTTYKDVAKKEKIYKEHMRYGPITIIVGAGHLLKGVEDALIGKNPGDSFEVEVQPAEGFGNKNSKLIKIIPEKIFREQKIKPYPRMQVNFDNLMGVVVSVSGGRVIVDFNHPLSGRILYYSLKIHKTIEDQNERIYALMELYANLGKKDIELEIKDKTVKITYKSKAQLSDQAKEVISDSIKKYIGLKNVELLEAKAKSEKKPKKDKE